MFTEANSQHIVFEVIVTSSNQGFHNFTFVDGDCSNRSISVGVQVTVTSKAALSIALCFILLTYFSPHPEYHGSPRCQGI